MSKSDKYMGRERPRDKRKQDPVPSRPTPAPSGKRMQKRYGYSYECVGGWRKDKTTVKVYRWYETRIAAEQAFKAFRHKWSSYMWYCNIKKEEQ